MPVILSSQSRKRNQKIAADESLIVTSMRRFQITADAESKWRRQALDDLTFSIGTGQWDQAVKSNREIEGKPCLTINRAPSFIRQYTGEERQHRPAMIVSPIGNGADLEAARIHQGVLRHVEVVSRAEVTYDSSYDFMLRIGSCPWRVLVDWTHERSFDQEPRIESIDNPFSVFLSPVRRPDGTDPLWGHVIRDYSKDEYRAEFGKDTEMAKLNFPTTTGNAAPSWVTRAGARVAEYWWIELVAKSLCMLDDGTTMFEDEIEKQVRDDRGKFRRNVMLDRIVQRRDTTVRKVHCVKHDALTVIAEYEWLGKYLPFPEIFGSRLNVNGEIYRAGMVRDYRDAQRIYDFMVTRQVEQVDMVSKDPLWVPDANAQYAEDYRQMNRKNYAHLFFKAYDENGKQLPAPQRAGREAPIQAMSEVIRQADYDMKAVVGIYGPSLGEQGLNNESGFSVFTRQEQADTAAINWHDNLNRGILWQAFILLDLWPKYINQARVQRIVNPDDSIRHAVIYSSQNGDSLADAMKLMNPQLGLKKAYDVSYGLYDAALSTGPMYKAARQEAFKALTAVIAENPQQMLPVVGDLWAKNADFPDADVLEQRFKKMMDPRLLDASSDDLQTKLNLTQAQLTQLTQQYNIMLQELNRAADTIRTDRLSNESRERIALMNNWTQILVQRLKSHDAAAQAAMDAQLAQITQRLSLIGENVTPQQDAGGAPNVPELPNSVEPQVKPMTLAAPTPRPQPVGQPQA